MLELSIPVLLTAALLLVAVTSQADPIAIGSRLEPMVDDFLIDTMDDAELTLHHPTAREIVMRFDEPWEGSGCGYVTMFEDEGTFRMYYKAWDLGVHEEGTKPSKLKVGYAESDDGIDWSKPELGIIEFDGSTANNLVWDGPGSHGFAPFKDPNPDVEPEAAYKAVGEGTTEAGKGLLALQSADGIHWELMRKEPILTGCPFDSQNLAFWDPVREEYRAYVRDFREGRRSIKTATSENFVNWTELQWLDFPGARKEQLYTNQVQPYPRAPHIFIGFPTRYFERGWSPSLEKLPDLENRRMRSRGSNRYGMAITDALLMTSRDGQTFNRWAEALVRPGPERPGSWAYGDMYLQWGLVRTASHMKGAADRWSLYSKEGFWLTGDTRMRRYDIRIDGFASVTAPMAGGEMITRPLVFDGDCLVINFSTSGSGGIHVEIQDADGQPIEGYTLDESDEVFGDSISRTVTWRDGDSDLSELSGKPVRLRFVLRDADLYALRFQKDSNR
ncbi:MAG: hypothetical protein R6V19_12620 [Armatimonadota bacterium]